MQLLSSHWSVSFGAFTLSGVLKSDDLEAALRTSATILSVPAHPEKEMKLHAPCGMFDPSAPAAPEHFLDGSGNTWVGIGTRTVANSPSPSLVEPEFRRLALERFGTEWPTTKKSKLNYLRRKAKMDLAARTPFRLSEAGALFVCLQTGAVVSVGHAGVAVAKDLVGRVGELMSVNFSLPVLATSAALLAFLRLQENSSLPWPTGTAALYRKRGDAKESCSVRQLSWQGQSADAMALINNNWRPAKVEVQWDATRKGIVGLTGRLEGVSWGAKIEAADPHPTVESRLARLIEMDEEVHAVLLSCAPEGTPLFPGT